MRLPALLRMTQLATVLSPCSSDICHNARSEDGVPPPLRVGTLNQHSLFEITVEQLRDHLSQHEISAVEYTRFCLERIRRLNPYLEAVIETNPDAIAIAHTLDNENVSGYTRSPLHGIPVLVKDNMATADLMQTTAGSWSLLGSVVPRDAFIVKKLREAGAVILGHSNMGEWASCRSKVYSTGYSPRGGQVRNPFDLSKSPFGSSSGSAAAVSANIVPVAFGTETDTSIIGPAGINGIVGIKPTVGLTSRTGVIPISEHMDTVGSMGRTVADAVAGLDAIVGPDPEDPLTMVPERPQPMTYRDFLSPASILEGAKFGLPIKRLWNLVPADTKEVISTLFEALKDTGAEIVEVDFPSIEERTKSNGIWDWEHGAADKSEWTVAKVDAYNGINDYLSTLNNTHIKSVEDIVEYNNQNKGTEGGKPGMVPAFPSGQDNLLEVAASKGSQNSTYQSALVHTHRQTRENGIDAALTYHDPGTNQTRELDALLISDGFGIGQQYAAQAGYPIICIPIGLNKKGMPISLSLQHTAWREADLVKWASAIEDLWYQSRGWRDTPKYLNLLAKNIPIDTDV